MFGQNKEDKGEYSDMTDDKKLPEKNGSEVMEEGLPAKDLPVKDLPEENLPEKDPPVKDLPEENLPAKDSPVKDLPEENLPEKDLQEENQPEKALPGEGQPEEGLPETDLPEKAGDSDYYDQDPEDEPGNESEDDPEYEYDYDDPDEEHGSVFAWIRGILLLVLCIAATFLMTFAYSLWSEYSGRRPYKGETIEVEIPRGSSVRNVAGILQEAGAIRYETTFLAKVYFSGKKDLKYGTYHIVEGDTLGDIVNKLTAGDIVPDSGQFVVPEGYSIQMIAAKLDKGGIISGEEFLAAVDRAEEGFVYADQLPSKDKVTYPLQGYLFPDTYALAEGTSADQLVNMMLDEFTKVFDEERQKKAKKLGLSVEEVLIRASLVQKESQHEEDYPKIAGVINNRLEKGMKLQFDSTVVYVITDGQFGVDRVTYENLSVKSPYNTYIVKGLPPGPICNPGLAAIDGVLNPEKHDYLYFRTDPTKDDGSNVFTKTYEEHMSVGGSTEDGADKKQENTEKKETTDKKKEDTKKKKETTDKKEEDTN